MIGRLISHATNSGGYLLTLFKLDFKFRNNNDIRAVFYHGIGKKTSPCMAYLNDEISLDIFREHINHLQKHYTLMSLRNSVSASKSRELTKEKPICNISFDDGLHSVYTNAFPILRERGISFDVFVNTSSIGNKSLLWLHAINYLLFMQGASDISQSMNHIIGSSVFTTKSGPKEIERWCRDNFELVYEKDLVGNLFLEYGLCMEEIAREQKLYLNWSQIEDMSHSGVDFYSHTHSHFPLGAFSNEDVVREEIIKANEVMASNGKSIEFLSFPFGMEVDYGRASIQHAQAAGHTYIVEVGNGVNSPNRINNEGIVSRVGLGKTGPKSSDLYSAIEVQPPVKNRLKSLARRLNFQKT